MPRQQPTQHTRTTRDQHRPRPVQHRRHGEHDLAGVPGLAHVAQGLGRATDVPGGERQRAQSALLEEFHDRDEHLAEPVGAGIQHVERLVADARVVLGNLLGVTDVGLPHLHEPATARQQVERGVHELPCQGVQHDVHTRAPGRGEERFAEVQVPGGSEVVFVDAESADDIPFGAARGGEDLGAEVLGELNRGHAHPAGGGVDQHRLACL